ncbi:hypothetical protein WN944_006557 [Citrus x changshan-huyou]|uniref:Uncharacterized protein n=1 Tax=Citrus x changshan-huyou TaxID=2935761 RepID=A0AAP0MJD4_9ROSI
MEAFMPELLCRRNRDRDGVNDEFSFGEVSSFPNGEWTLGLPAFNSTKSRGSPFFLSRASKNCQVSIVVLLRYPTPETGGPVFVGYASTKTSSDEQTSGNRVPRAGISCKSLVSGGAGISCSSTRPISYWKHKAIPATFLLRVESRRPGQRQLARRALQFENQGTKATQPPTTTEMGHPLSRGGRTTSANGGKARVQRWPIKRDFWRRNVTRRNLDRGRVDRAEILVVVGRATRISHQQGIIVISQKLLIDFKDWRKGSEVPSPTSPSLAFPPPSGSPTVKVYHHSQAGSGFPVWLLTILW